jgi:hypothetical protein
MQAEYMTIMKRKFQETSEWVKINYLPNSFAEMNLKF